MNPEEPHLPAPWAAAAREGGAPDFLEHFVLAGCCSHAEATKALARHEGNAEQAAEHVVSRLRRRIAGERATLQSLEDTTEQERRSFREGTLEPLEAQLMQMEAALAAQPPAPAPAFAPALVVAAAPPVAFAPPAASAPPAGAVPAGGDSEAVENARRQIKERADTNAFLRTMDGTEAMVANNLEEIEQLEAVIATAEVATAAAAEAAAAEAAANAERVERARRKIKDNNATIAMVQTMEGTEAMVAGLRQEIARLEAEVAAGSALVPEGVPPQQLGLLLAAEAHEAEYVQPVGPLMALPPAHAPPAYALNIPDAEPEPEPEEVEHVQPVGPLTVPPPAHAPPAYVQNVVDAEPEPEPEPEVEPPDNRVERPIWEWDDSPLGWKIYNHNHIANMERQYGIDQNGSYSYREGRFQQGRECKHGAIFIAT